MGLHLLYKILKEKKADMLIKIPRKWFILPEEKREYKRIVSFLKKYGELPKPPDTYPIGYEDQPISYYIDEMRKRYAKRVIAKIKTAEVSDETVDKFLNYVNKEVSSLITESYGEYVILPKELPEVAQKVTDVMRKNKVAGLFGYPTGYSLLDLNTGGYIPGDVFVFVARTKAGKTMYSLNSVRKLAKEVPCMFVSMEMPVDSIMRRLLALEFKISNFVSQVRIVSSFVDKDFEKLKLNLTLVNGAYIRDVSDLYSLISFYNPKAVFLDGAYLLNPDKSYRSEWEKAKNIIEELRKLALKTGVALVCTWQLSRQAVKKIAQTGEPEPEHISFTDAVAQSATAVIGIVPDSEPRYKNFFVMCNREGKERIKIKVHWDWETMNFEEADVVEIADTSNLEDLLDRHPFGEYLDLLMEGEGNDEERETN